MVEFGWFADQRIELLRGTLVDLSPHRWPHTAAIEFLTEQLILQLGGRYSVRPQMPFFADDWSEPQPDLAVAEKDPTLRDHPSELLLLIEIADEPLIIERGPKLTIYAGAGVPEYWIVDVSKVIVEVHTQPENNRYANVQTFRDGDVLRPTLLPDVAIRVADLPR